jgi:hypothetical protein
MSTTKIISLLALLGVREPTLPSQKDGSGSGILFSVTHANCRRRTRDSGVIGTAGEDFISSSESNSSEQYCKDAHFSRSPVDCSSSEAAQQPIIRLPQLLFSRFRREHLGGVVMEHDCQTIELQKKLDLTPFALEQTTPIHYQLRGGGFQRRS